MPQRKCRFHSRPSTSRAGSKPIAVIDASQRSVHADASLRLVLETMAARGIGSASITLLLDHCRRPECDTTYDVRT